MILTVLFLRLVVLWAYFYRTSAEMAIA